MIVGPIAMFFFGVVCCYAVMRVWNSATKLFTVGDNGWGGSVKTYKSFKFERLEKLNTEIETLEENLELAKETKTKWQLKAKKLIGVKA